MSAYDFRTLSPLDFEELCHDLFEALLGVSLESFKAGRDSGIDLRHAFTSGDALIIQCKHYVESGFSKLLTALSKSERSKLERLKPQRYILSTSVGLTPANSDALANAAAPYCLGSNDIYGSERLNALLRANPRIVENHFKLWLTSAPLLQRILHNAAFVRSAIDRQEIANRLKLFVQTSAVNLAKGILDREHACIITGDPGIGKTTLAQILLCAYIAKGWEVVSARENVREILDVYDLNPETKQVFYYDDFLGTINFESYFKKNEDRSILQLIQFVRGNEKKRLILTTREYILRDAQLHSELLARGADDHKKFLLSLASYTDEDKARILVNHLHFQGVPADHIASIVDNRNYMTLITHKNYNPRIVEYMTDMTVASSIEPRDYFSEFKRSLDHPDVIWRHAYQRKLTQASRDLLLCLVSCGHEVLLDDLRIAFESFHLARADKYRFQASPTGFQDSLAILENSFIRIVPYRDGTTVTVFNPSVLDFMCDELRRDVGTVKELVRHAAYYEQLERLTSLLSEGGTDKRVMSMVAKVQTELPEACIRLISGQSLRLLIRVWTKPAELSRVPADLSARLRFLIEVFRACDDRRVQNCIKEVADQYFAAAGIQKYGPSSYVPLLEAIGAFGKFEPYTVRGWEASVAACFDEPLEDWEDAQSLAGWLGSTEGFSEHDVAIATSRVRDMAEAEVDDAVGSKDRDRIEGLMQELDEVEGCVYIGARELICQLKERVAELEQRDESRGYGDPDDWRAPIRSQARTDARAAGVPSTRIEDLLRQLSQRTGPSPSAIDRMFDSICE